jgi:hypothetical protein
MECALTDGMSPLKGSFTQERTQGGQLNGRIRAFAPHNTWYDPRTSTGT